MAWMRPQVRSLSRPPIFQLKSSTQKKGERPDEIGKAAGSIPVTSTIFQFRTIFNNLFQNFGGKARESVIFHGVTNLNGIATNFAILNVRLSANRKVQHHRNFFPAIGTIEEMFH